VTQTYRTNDVARWGTGQGFNLTAAQVDINFWDIVQRMIAQEARPDPSAGIDHFEIIGVNMYVHMTDATVLGPYVLPVATFHDRGAWAPSTVYSVMDTFSVNGGLYVVIFDHTSGTTFDPGANDGSGHDYYQLMIQTPGSSLPSGGAVGQILKKTTTTDYAVGWGQDDAALVTFAPATGSVLTSINVADALEEVAALSGAATVTYTDSIQYVIDGGGVTLTTGLKGAIEIPFACTITAARLLADRSGSVIVNVYKCSYSAYDAGSTHPVAGDKITSSTPPTIASATKSSDTTLTGWTTAIGAADLLAFNVDSATTIQRVTIALTVSRTIP
jgi:hypothetical protein